MIDRCLIQNHWTFEPMSMGFMVNVGWGEGGGGSIIYNGEQETEPAVQRKSGKGFIFNLIVYKLKKELRKRTHQDDEERRDNKYNGFDNKMASPSHVNDVILI